MRASKFYNKVMKLSEAVQPVRDLYDLTKLRHTRGDQIVDQYSQATAMHFDVLKKACLTDASPINFLLIPARNEEEDLPGTLLAASRAENVLPFVLNNNSTDKTGEVATSMGAILIDVPVGGIIASVQAGIKRAMEYRVDKLFFTDADTLVPPTWHKAMDERLNQVDQGKGAIAYGNAVLWYGEHKSTDMVLSVGKALRFAIHGMHSDPELPAYGYNHAIRFDRDGRIIEEIRKLDPRITNGADTQVKNAVLSAGGTVGYAHGMRSWVVPRNDRITTVRQRLKRSYLADRDRAYNTQYAQQNLRQAS